MLKNMRIKISPKMFSAITGIATWLSAGRRLAGGRHKTGLSFFGMSSISKLLCSDIRRCSLATVRSGDVSTWDRCHDFKNILAERFSKNIGVFCSNYC
jgi:hypothetical protein